MWLNPTVLLVEAQRVLHRGREGREGGRGGKEGGEGGREERGRGNRECISCRVLKGMRQG